MTVWPESPLERSKRLTLESEERAARFNDFMAQFRRELVFEAKESE